MKGKIFCALLGSMVLGASVYGQTTVNGELIDGKGNSLADITVSAGAIKTKTDSHGKFSLYYPEKGLFELSFTGVGFVHNLFKVTPKGNFTYLQPIVLHRSQKEIDQIDIEGYKSPNNQIINVGKGNISDKDLPQAV